MDNELYHYGVKGMRWGVRRYRNDERYQKIGKKYLVFDKQEVISMACKGKGSKKSGKKSKGK